jgi:glycosyltransferase involved in cell wall biosynthesis
MRILYQIATLRPKALEIEAVSQEVANLQKRFGGRMLYVNPNQWSPVYIPRLLFGFHRLREIRAWKADLHHFFNPDPFPFPYLRVLRRPVIYSLTCGVSDRKPNVRFFSSLAAVIVSDKRSLKWLRSWGLDNVFLVSAGIDTSRFSYTPTPLRSEIRLMVGSAPWSKSQFKTKGVDALLRAARQMPELRLVFLWRGVLTEEMLHRVHRMGLESQVEILDNLVDVNKVLSKVHASVTLAMESDIVKSYPHSLMESLAAGKPVLISRAIPMADYVEEKGCGVVVEEVRPQDVLSAVESLARGYDRLQGSAQRWGRADFSMEEKIASFENAYKEILLNERSNVY